MRRRRRNNGTWLPTLGTSLGEDLEANLSGRVWSQPVLAQDISTTIIPITTDAPTYAGDNVTQTTIMADVLGNEYFLDRIVGKVFVQFKPGNDGATTYLAWPTLVVCGFFVARADDGNHLQPIGAATSVGERDEYSPADADTIREPWIWRRAWILGIQGNYDMETTLAGDSSAPFAWPASNSQYGSVADGPHIDCKTKRRVGQEDRLWFACSSSYIPGFGAPTTDPVGLPAVNGYLDFRLHGALRKARPTGRF